MTYRTITVLNLFLAGVVAGCAGPDRYRPSVDHRVLPPPVATRQQTTRSEDGGVKPARADLSAAEVVRMTPPPGEPGPPVTDGRCASAPLSLPDAIALAYRMQPRLRVFLEGV